MSFESGESEVLGSGRDKKEDFSNYIHITRVDMGFESGKTEVIGSGSDKKDDYSNYFHLPFGEAAKAANVGETHFREMTKLQGIERWPYRKLRCLETLINQCKEMGKDTDLLEQEKKLLKNNPNMGLSKETKLLAKAVGKKRARLSKNNNTTLEED